MQEPSSNAFPAAAASLTAGLIALFGPVLGVWVSVFFTSLVGAMWAMGKMHTHSRIAAAWLVLRLVLTSMVLTGSASALLSSQFNIDPDHLLPIVGFSICALGDKLEGFRGAFAKRLRHWIGGG